MRFVQNVILKKNNLKKEKKTVNNECVNFSQIFMRAQQHIA